MSVQKRSWPGGEWLRYCELCSEEFEGDDGAYICRVCAGNAEAQTPPTDAPGGAVGAGEPGSLVNELRSLTLPGYAIRSDIADRIESGWQADRLRAEAAEKERNDYINHFAALKTAIGAKFGDDPFPIAARLVADRTALADLRAGVKNLADDLQNPDEKYIADMLTSLLPDTESAAVADARPAAAESETQQQVCTAETPCCDRRGEYSGFGSGPLIFTCPKGCSCHD